LISQKAVLRLNQNVGSNIPCRLLMKECVNLANQKY